MTENCLLQRRHDCGLLKTSLAEITVDAGGFKAVENSRLVRYDANRRLRSKPDRNSQF